MNILIIGAPGSGKGTVSEYLQNNYNVLHVSTGNVIREEIRKESEIGNYLKDLIDNGQFAPDNVVAKIVKDKLAVSDGDILIDGFPRNLAQVEIFESLLDESNQKIDLVFEMNISSLTIAQRLKERLVCPSCGTSYHKEFKRPKIHWKCDYCVDTELTKRKDDASEIVIKRLDIYKSETSPILDFYRNKGIVRTLNGEESIELVLQSVDSIMQSFKGDL